MVSCVRKLSTLNSTHATETCTSHQFLEEAREFADSGSVPRIQTDRGCEARSRERMQNLSRRRCGDASLALLVDNHSADQKRGNHKPEYNSIDIHIALLVTDHTRLWID